MLPLEWVAKLKCVEFWHRVRKLGDERLVKHVVVEAWKQREMKCMKDLRQSIREMGTLDTCSVVNIYHFGLYDVLCVII